MDIMIQAVSAHQKGKFKEAEQLYRSILEYHPTNLDIINNLGVLLRTLGRLDEAEASYRKAIELNPSYASAHNNLGITLKDLGKFSSASPEIVKECNIIDSGKPILINSLELT